MLSVYLSKQTQLSDQIDGFLLLKGRKLSEEGIFELQKSSGIYVSACGKIGFSTIPGGCLGFLNHQQYVSFVYPKKLFLEDFFNCGSLDTKTRDVLGINSTFNGREIFGKHSGLSQWSNSIDGKSQCKNKAHVMYPP